MAIGIVVGFIVLSLLVMAVWFAQKKKKKGTGSRGSYAAPSPFTSSHNSGISSCYVLPTTTLGMYYLVGSSMLFVVNLGNLLLR